MSRASLVWAFMGLCALSCCSHWDATVHGRRHTEEQLIQVLSDVFAQENDVSDATDVTKLKGHAWNLQEMQWDVIRQRHVKQIQPWLDRLHAQCRDEADFIRSVDRVVHQVGCSKALIVALVTCSQHLRLRDWTEHDFAFMRVSVSRLDPEYRYSRRIIEDRVLYYSHHWKD